MQALATITRRVKTTFSSSAKDEPLLLGAIAKQRTDLDTVCDVADYLQKLIDEDLLEVTAVSGPSAVGQMVFDRLIELVESRISHLVEVRRGEQDL